MQKLVFANDDAKGDLCSEDDKECLSEAEIWNNIKQVFHSDDIHRKPCCQKWGEKDKKIDDFF